MKSKRRILLAGACLLGLMKLSGPAYGGDFAAFGEDEDVCRQAGTAAIQGATGPTAAQRYDFAHGKCMADHGRMRMMEAYRNAAPPFASPFDNPDSFAYPDAFYSVPYATPGYGYDGFSR